MKKATNNAQPTVSALKVKMEVLERLERIFEELKSREESISTDYECVGKEEEQATNWRTGELLWEDEEQTIPKYNNKYESVPKKPENFTEEDLAQLEAIKIIRTTLETLI